MLTEAVHWAAAKGRRVAGEQPTGPDPAFALLVLLAVPSGDTPRVQECHTALIHLICELAEAAVAGSADR